MTGPAYPPARAVAASIEAHFAHNIAAARRRGMEDLSPQLDTEAITTVISTAFWASLRREEGRDPQISLALLPSESAGEAMIFESPLPLTAEALARLAPAVVRPGIHLGVWPDGGHLLVWGIARRLPCLCFVLEVVEPGMLVIKYRRGEGIAKFGNVAVLKGDEIKIVDERLAGMPDYPAVLASLLSFDPAMSLRDSPAVLIRLAVSMRAHGHGGALLVVPTESRSWTESIVWPVPYEVRRSRSEIAELMREARAEESSDGPPEAIGRAIDAVAGLTAVDGATVISSAFEVLAFGVKIGRAARGTPVSQVITTEPVVGDTPTIVHATQLGGTRHLSAAQFVHDQRDTLALVASQDGRFTLFAWSPSQRIVRAHSIASLLV